MKKCILIIGMHRSGTSLISSLIGEFKFFHGHDLLGSLQENPRGFFENKKLYKINEYILKNEGMKWFDTKKIHIENNKILYKNLIINTINEQFDGNKKIVIKDPRLVFLYDLYREVLLEKQYNIYTIIVVRNKISVIKSLYKRSGFGYYYLFNLIDHYNNEINEIMNKYNYMIISYDDINNYIDLYKIMNNVSIYINESYNHDKIYNLYNKNLKRSNINLIDYLWLYLFELYKRIKK